MPFPRRLRSHPLWPVIGHNVCYLLYLALAYGGGRLHLGTLPPVVGAGAMLATHLYLTLSDKPEYEAARTDRKRAYLVARGWRAVVTTRPSGAVVDHEALRRLPLYVPRIRVGYDRMVTGAWYVFSELRGAFRDEARRRATADPRSALLTIVERDAVRYELMRVTPTLRESYRLYRWACANRDTALPTLDLAGRESLYAAYVATRGPLDPDLPRTGSV